MADKSDPGVPQFFELGALEREGAFWRFTLSNADCGLLLKYGSEENARRARMLIFEALRDVLQSSTEATASANARLEGKCGPVASRETPLKYSNCNIVECWIVSQLEFSLFFSRWPA